MLMILALMASDVVEARAAVLTYYDSYVTCMENQAVVAGAFNKLPTSVVVDTASRRCSDELKRFFSSFYDGETTSPRHDEQIRSFVFIAEGKASEAVIAVRSGSLGTGGRAR